MIYERRYKVRQAQTIHTLLISELIIMGLLVQLTGEAHSLFHKMYYHVVDLLDILGILLYWEVRH